MTGLFIDHVVDRKKNIHMYHVGFSSCQEYQDFYAWHNARKLRYELTDMPHDYFVYLNEEDRIEMYYRFGDHITDTVEDNIDLSRFRDFLDPSPDDPLAELLYQEIQREINLELLRELKRASR